MLINRRIGLMAAGTVALVFLLGWVSTAQARSFSMSGKWVQRRGVAYIPVYPNLNGIGVKAGGALAEVQGLGAPSMTIPTDAFTGNFVIPGFPLGGSLISLTTHFNMAGPKAAGKFKKNFWVGNRPFKDFAHCPGAAVNPLCVDHRISIPKGGPAATGQGTLHGLVRYKAGVNAYGGTMQMVAGGGGTLQRIINAVPLKVAHLPFGGITGAAPTEAPGGPYANISLVDYLPNGPVTQSPIMTSGGLLISAPGIDLGYGIAETTIQNRGFSWTTGKVYVTGTAARTSYPGKSTIVTVTGSDNRTGWGGGNITLVAGGIGNRIGSSQLTFVDFDRIVLTLSPLTGVPAMSRPTLAAAAGLMLLAFGYAVRRYSSR